MRTKRKCVTLNFLKTYHASIIENRPLLKFKFIFRSRIKRKRKRVIFFKRKYFTLKRLRSIKFVKSNVSRKIFKRNFKKKFTLLNNNKNNYIIKNFLQNYKKL